MRDIKNIKNTKYIYGSTKTYTHSIGLSCAFRQWRAQSHCRFIHGYALEVKLTFQALKTDENGWVVDFGDMKEIKSWLEGTFDHKLIVAESDPHYAFYSVLSSMNIAQCVYLPEVGCENFAEYIAEYVRKWVDFKYGDRVQLGEVEVREHGGNSAFVQPIYSPNKDE